MRFLTLSSLFIVIFSKESGIKKFHLVKLLQDYDITDEPYFNSRKRSLVSCAGQCIDTKSCVSVFYSASSCKGFKFLHPLNHTSLTKMVGTKYYVAYSTSNQVVTIRYRLQGGRQELSFHMLVWVISLTNGYILTRTHISSVMDKHFNRIYFKSTC